MAVALGMTWAGSTQAAARPEAWPAQHPNLELSSAFFAGATAAPASRSVLSLMLRAETSPASEGLTAGFAFGWVMLSEPGDGGQLRTSGPSNLSLFGTHHFVIDESRGLDGEIELGLTLGITRSGSEPYRRLVRTAYGHSIAMQGIWDAWLWAPERGGFVLPVRVESLHRMGAWHALASGEVALAATLPNSDAGERSLGRLLQMGAAYQVLPRGWLAAGSRLRFVWMPTATLFRTQWSVCPFLAVVIGRWRLGAELLVNLDEPYGFVAMGQRIWAATFKVGAWF